MLILLILSVFFNCHLFILSILLILDLFLFDLFDFISNVYSTFSLLSICFLSLLFIYVLDKVRTLSQVGTSSYMAYAMQELTE